MEERKLVSLPSELASPEVLEQPDAAVRAGIPMEEPYVALPGGSEALPKAALVKRNDSTRSLNSDSATAWQVPQVQPVLVPQPDYRDGDPKHAVSQHQSGSALLAASKSPS